MNMQSLLKQAQKMQKELAKAEELLNEQTYDSTMGGGVVKVTVKGSMVRKRWKRRFRRNVEISY